MDDRELTVYVYDESIRMIGVVEKYVSLVWSDRYDEAGDFELETIFDFELYDLFQKDRFCSIDYSKHKAIIEKVEISKDEEGNSKIVVTGHSVEIITDRRIVLIKTEIGKEEPEVLQNVFERLFDENLINPSDEKRKIQNFVFHLSDDSIVNSLMISDETYDKDTLYDVVKGQCADKHIGFEIDLDDSGVFNFSLYKGKDLSDSVLFSPFYDNLNNSQYFSSSEDYKNVMFISKNDEEFITVSVNDEEPTGIKRRETHESSSDLKENKEGDLTDEELRSKALKKLKQEYKIKTGFEGDIIPDVFYTYRDDYNVGDKVMLEDEYGNKQAVYISEVVITYDENGLSIIPTFEEIDWDEEDFPWA